MLKLDHCFKLKNIPGSKETIRKLVYVSLNSKQMYELELTPMLETILTEYTVFGKSNITIENRNFSVKMINFSPNIYSITEENKYVDIVGPEGVIIDFLKK